jgi:hypothetical protein
MARITVRLADPSARVPDVARAGAPLLPSEPFEADDAAPFIHALLADGTLIRVAPTPSAPAKPVTKEK